MHLHPHGLATLEPSKTVIIQICPFDYPQATIIYKLRPFFLPMDAPDMNVHLTLAAILVLFFSVALIHV